MLDVVEKKNDFENFELWTTDRKSLGWLSKVNFPYDLAIMVERCISFKDQMKEGWRGKNHRINFILVKNP